MKADDALKLVEEIYALKDKVQSSSLQFSEKDTHFAAQEALDIAQTLLEGILSWAYDIVYPSGPIDNDFEELRKESPDAQRARFIMASQWPPSLVPPVLHENLIEALFCLDLGLIQDIVKPLPKSGRGANPQVAREAEQAMLLWIEFQAGLGMSKDEARRQVADAVGRSSKAVEAWVKGYRKRVGETHAKRTLQLYFRAGQTRAAGLPDSPRWINCSPLEQLAQKWKQAKRSL